MGVDRKLEEIVHEKAVSKLRRMLFYGPSDPRVQYMYNYTIACSPKIPVNEDYKFMGMWAGELLWTLRMTVGDFHIIKATPKDTVSKYLFWIGFLTIIFSSNIILLNFIVAEASNSYNRVVEKLDQIIWKGKSDLISEADSITWKKFKTQKKFPKYLVVRQVAN